MPSVSRQTGRARSSLGSCVSGMHPGVPSSTLFGVPTSVPHDTALMVWTARMPPDRSQSQTASAENAATRLTEQTASKETACLLDVDCCCTEEPLISVAAFFPRGGIRLVRWKEVYYTEYRYLNHQIGSMKLPQLLSGALEPTDFNFFSLIFNKSSADPGLGGYSS